MTGEAGQYDRHKSEVSFVMGADLDASRFRNDRDLTTIGNGLDNKMDGNDGENRLEGRAGDDILDGDRGHDMLIGGTGDDTLDGGRGRDTLAGGAGDDCLDGGRDDDVFIFETGGGHDVIEDFEDNDDTLWLDVSGVASVAEALAFATGSRGDVIFDFGGGDRITVEDMEIAELANDLLIL
ncbi:hypothetical protein JANAI62_36860 [Jannaschia pagri]|uniref:Hemolysin-type calcium-binding repeat-containing protein n=1 Tax=Jannaschia pagri TaxID=2829797 RepID=A0ABQ4NRM2_9RHOB|nr:hypothetical protein JANAI61_36280 [Jannaschia sp. AI_61]GIT97063.1 hypothetical protein JANAI62_36860 [Jannaschia sp. AI_62]